MSAGKYELLSFPNPEALARAVAEQWTSQMAVTNTVALSGGRIARQFYAEVVKRRPRIAHLHFFWADERCVPADDPESNYRTARECLFEPLGVEEMNVHRVRGEGDPQLASQAASEELAQIAPVTHKYPVLDLVFLGMGEDGHVASLFPGALPQPGIYYPVIGPKPPPQRITLSYDVLEAAREVWVMVSGPGKARALQDSLSAETRTPLGRVVERRASTRIFCDFPVKSA